MRHRKHSEEPDTTATPEVEKQQKEDKHIGCLSVIALMISLSALLIGAAQLTQVSYNSGYVKGYEEAVEAVESVLTRGGGTT
jgi:hypothetical protein